MRVYVIRRADGTLRVASPELAPAFFAPGESRPMLTIPPAIRELIEDAGDKVIGRADLISVGEYCEELAREMEEVRQWVRETQAERLRKAARLAFLRYRSRKNRQTAEGGSNG